MNPGVLGLLLLVSFALRLPFFFRDSIDRDEGAFIMVGQSLLDGHLPYVERFALKPPLAFTFYAGALVLIGKSVFAVRLAGALAVTATAFLVYLVAGRVWNRRVGLVAALLCVPVMSLLPSGQAAMTEHAAMPPLMAALYLLVRREPSTRSCFLTGVLAGVATLVRLNLAYAALAVGAFVLFASVRRAPRTAVRHALACAAGGLLVLALVWLPYALSGQRELWWRAVVLAPLAHTGRNPSISQNLTAHSLRALGVYRDASGFAYVGLPVITFVWLAAMGGTVLLVVRRAAVGGDLRGVALLGLTTLGVGVGIIKSGSPHPHHVIQLAPLGAALAGVFLDWATGRRRVPAALIVFALMVTSSRVVAAEYQTIAERARAGQPLAHGAAFEIAAYLRRENPERRPVFLMSDNVAYWLSGVGPPSRMTTHFGTLHDPVVMTALTGRPTSTLDELQSVFQRRPKFVVASENVARLPTWAWVRRLVAEEYVTASRIADRIVYRRRADP